MLVASSGCDPARGEVRSWAPSDHDQDPAPDQVDNAPQPKRSPAEERINRVWSQTCAKCHGPAGQGDGPMASTFHPPDLTSDDLLESLTDEQMAGVIKDGKGAMP